MTRLLLNTSVILLICIAAAAGCSGDTTTHRAKRPEWEPASQKLAPVPPPAEIAAFETPATPGEPFSAADFARELAHLSTRAATEVARLKAQAEIDSAFPSDAAFLLQQSADALKEIADVGYEPLEVELIDAYREYAIKTGLLEDTIILGESMEYVLGRDIVAYHQLNSMELNDIKRSYWRDKLQALSAELAAERCRFIFAKEGRFLARAASVGADQQAVIASLEENLQSLADDYAARVKAAIDAAAEAAGLAPALGSFEGVQMEQQVADFKAEFEKRHRKMKTITGD